MAHPGYPRRQGSAFTDEEAGMFNMAMRAGRHVAVWVVWQSLRVSLMDELDAPAPPWEANRAAVRAA